MEELRMSQEQIETLRNKNISADENALYYQRKAEELFDSCEHLQIEYDYMVEEKDTLEAQVYDIEKENMCLSHQLDRAKKDITRWKSKYRALGKSNMSKAQKYKENNNPQVTLVNNKANKMSKNTRKHVSEAALLNYQDDSNNSDSPRRRNTLAKVPQSDKNQPENKRIAKSLHEQQMPPTLRWSRLTRTQNSAFIVPKQKKKAS